MYQPRPFLKFLKPSNFVCTQVCRVRDRVGNQGSDHDGQRLFFPIHRGHSEVQSAGHGGTGRLRHGQSAVHTGRESSFEKIIRSVAYLLFITILADARSCRKGFVVYLRFGCVRNHIELRKLHDDVRQRGLSWFNGFRSEIKSEILRTVGFPPATELNWEQLADGPAWTWWLLSLLPLGQTAHVSSCHVVHHCRINLYTRTNLNIDVTSEQNVFGHCFDDSLPILIFFSKTVLKC